MVGVIAIILILLVLIPSGSNSDVLITNKYSSITTGKVPCIQFDNSTNFDPYWLTNLNSYKNIAYMNLTSVWSQDIYTDDHGIVYWVDNYGYVIYSVNGNINYIGSPYPYNFSFAGSVVSIAVIDDSYVWYVALLTVYGYVFIYDMNTKMWFNATNVWGLNLQNVWKQYSSPWSSVVSNTLGDSNGFHELFIFTNLNGEVYAFDTTFNSTRRGINNGGWWNSNPTSFKIVSTVAYYDERRNNIGHLFGVSYNGIVYKFQNGHWTTLVNSNLNGIMGISIGKSTDLLRGSTYFNNGYTLFIIQIFNGTTLYEYDSRNGIFKNYGGIFTIKGTNQAISFDLYNSYNNVNTWYILQTNGTIALSINNIATAWDYYNNFLFKYETSTALKIDSKCSLDFIGSLYYNSSIKSWNMYNFTIYFTSSNNLINLEFYYYWPTQQIVNPATETLLSSNNSILINFTYMPNMAFNSTFNFYLILKNQYPQNAIVYVYNFNINIVNHFNYIPI